MDTTASPLPSLGLITGTNGINLSPPNGSSSTDNETNTSFPMATPASLVTTAAWMYQSSTEPPSPTRPSSNESPSAILTGIVLYILVLITLVGNIFVLVAVYMEKSLQTAFNFFIVNLAITDTCVAATAMSFYATDMMLGYWPFGPAVCALWIFCDYGMTFASVFTLVAISADRFWSVYWSIQYRSINKRKKSLTMIAIVWVLMLVLWVPALVMDRLNNMDDEYFCMWDPAENREFVVVIALVGHHGPCILMLAFFFLVYSFLKKRAKLKPVNKGPQVAPNVSIKREVSVTEASADNGQHSPSTVIETTQAVDPSTNNIPPTSGDTKNQQQPLSASNLLTEKSITFLQVPGNKVDADASSSGEGGTSAASEYPSSVSNQKNPRDKSVGGLRRSAKSNQSSEASKAEKRNKREMKVFVTLTYIIVGYVICWVPFHIVFDIQALAPALVPSTVYNLTFWLTYINSSINPFLYNFSSPEFRDAFKKIFACATNRKARTVRATSSANNQITPSV